MKKKLKIMRDNIVDYNVMYTLTSRIMNYMQWFLKKHQFMSFFIFCHDFQYFSYILFPSDI